MYEPLTCKTCGKTKPYSEFVDGVRHRCKSCRRDIQLKKTYGLEPGEYEAKWEAQSGLCMVCKKPSHAVWKSTKKPRRLSQDPDHETGQNRDLLCDRCNRGLGNFLEDPELLEAAAAYLRRWGK